MMVGFRAETNIIYATFRPRNKTSRFTQSQLDRIKLVFVSEALHSMTKADPMAILSQVSCLEQLLFCANDLQDYLKRVEFFPVSDFFKFFNLGSYILQTLAAESRGIFTVARKAPNGCFTQYQRRCWTDSGVTCL